MPPSAPLPQKYANLKFRKTRRSSRDFEEYQYVGTRAPSWKELEDAHRELFTSAAHSICDSHLNGAGFTKVNGAPVAADSRGYNAIHLAFDSKTSLESFLQRPIPPFIRGISLELKVSKGAHFL
jgi:hypothetical protein